MRKVDIFGIKYSVTDYQGASDLIIEKAKKREKFSVFALPVHGVIERRRDPKFSLAVEGANMILPDGQPIKWAMNYYHQTGLEDRVYGPELTRAVLIKANEIGLSVFLYGGSTSSVLERFSRYIEREYPNVKICGAYREEIFGETTLSNEWVSSLKPDIVLVGLGCPHQEKWISGNLNEIGGVLMGVGAAFSFYSGEIKIAPAWMQKRGLEWLYRLAIEPRRLWRRYLYANSYFIFLILKKIILK